MKDLEIALAALKEIAHSCPLLNANKNAMYGKDADAIFAKSTTRRMELAEKALKEIDENIFLEWK